MKSLGLSLSYLLNTVDRKILRLIAKFGPLVWADIMACKKNTVTKSSSTVDWSETQVDVSWPLTLNYSVLCPWHDVADEYISVFSGNLKPVLSQPSGLSTICSKLVHTHVTAELTNYVNFVTYETLLSSESPTYVNTCILSS